MGNRSCAIFCHRNIITVKGEGKSDVVKGQEPFFVKVKSQSNHLADKKFDRGQRSE